MDVVSTVAILASSIDCHFLWDEKKAVIDYISTRDK